MYYTMCIRKGKVDVHTTSLLVNRTYCFSHMLYIEQYIPKGKVDVHTYPLVNNSSHELNNVYTSPLVNSGYIATLYN